MTAPRLEIDLDAIQANARILVDRLARRAIRVTGITKAALAAPSVAGALERGGVAGLGDSRVENLERLRSAGLTSPLTLIRSPMLSQAQRVVASADVSLNSELAVLNALSRAAVAQGRTHSVILMIELGDLREGVAVGEALALAGSVTTMAGLRLVGLGTNLACQCGVVPDQQKMLELSDLAGEVESSTGAALDVVSGGNSANLEWALSTPDVGRVNDLRLGESILLGTEPLHRRPIEGLRTDAFTLVAEVIELQTKPAQPWGEIAQSAYGEQPARTGRGTVRQAILAVGRQDTDPDGLTLPPEMTILGMSSDHLVIDVADSQISVGDEMSFSLNYSALARSMTSPFVTSQDRQAVSARGRDHPFR